MKKHMRIAAAALAVGLGLSCMDATAAGTPITHELLWMMKRVGAPVVSPDGKWVIFSVLEPSYEADKEASDLWLVPADGSTAPRRITNTRAAESGGLVEFVREGGAECCGRVMTDGENRALVS